MSTIGINQEKERNNVIEEGKKDFLSSKLDDKVEKVENVDFKPLEAQKIEKQQLADNREDIAEFAQEYREEMVKRAESGVFEKEELVIDGVKHHVLKTEGMNNQVKAEESRAWLVILSEKIKKMWQAWQNQKKQEKI